MSAPQTHVQARDQLITELAHLITEHENRNMRHNMLIADLRDDLLQTRAELQDARNEVAELRAQLTRFRCQNEA